MDTDTKVTDLAVLATLISTDGTVAIKHFKNSTEKPVNYRPEIPKSVKPEDTLTVKYLAAITRTLSGVKVDDGTPFKFPVVDTLFPQFGEFIKVSKWTVKPGRGHIGESLYDQFAGDYYKTHWIKNPGSEKQAEFVESFAEQYLTDEYVLEGLTPESARSKENIIKALVNQTPRIFRVSKPETITRLSQFVKKFLQYYIKEENGVLSCKNVSIISSLQTNATPVHLVDKEIDYDEIMTAATAATVTVKFGTHKGCNIPGVMKIGANEFEVTISPVLGCYKNYENSELEVIFSKIFNYKLLAVPVQFAATFDSKNVILPRTEMAKFLIEKKGQAEMNFANQYGFLAAQFVNKILEDLNKETKAKIERAKKMEEIATTTENLLAYC